MKQARGMRNNNPLNIIKSEKINWQGEVKPSTDPNFAQWRLRQHRLQAHGTEPRPAAASDEGGDEGDVVRHRAGYGDDGVRTERETTRAARPVHRTRMADV